MFEITYSVVYTPSAGHIDTLNAQLEAAGWKVAEHDTAQASQDEAAHERLAQGGTGQEDGERRRRGTKRKAPDTDSDTDWEPGMERKRVPTPRSTARPDAATKPKSEAKSGTATRPAKKPRVEPGTGSDTVR